MIVFNLSCSLHHHFDGWFRTAEDFERQSASGLIACPICGDHEIVKHLSAPRINVGAAASDAVSGSATASAPTLPATVDAVASQAATAQDVVAASMMPSLQAHMLTQFKQFVMANTENVGGAFAETARRMHYGEEAHRNIRGRVSAAESQALREEGIDTVGLPPGIFLDESVQ
jgi:hypothetical protein